MLDLHSILWIIPGIIFIHLYNRRRPAKHEIAINLSGWRLIFALAIIASLTWLPAELTSQTIFALLKECDWIRKLFVWFSTIASDAEIEDIERIQTLLIAVFFTCILLLLVQIGPIARVIFLPVHDNFHKKCVEWENKAVILTLKNSKAYIGILWKYPESPKSRYESQTISIIPLQSGYREIEQKRVQWTTYYPYDQSDPHSMETIIPRHEILTFGKFNIKAHKQFEDLKTQSKT